MKEIILPHNHGEGHNTAHLYTKLCDTQRFLSVSELLKQLSDPVRVKIFWLLSHREECLINISALLDMSSPAISHHLRSMKECGIIQSRRDGKEVYYRIADNEICKLLHKTTEQIMDISCPLENGADVSDTIKCIHDYLLDNLDKRITIEMLSKKFLINSTTLKQTFKSIYKTSVAAHINKHRMEKAEQLIANSDKNISEIASLVGFSSQSRFTAAFKKIYGYTPTEYKNRGL